MLWQQSRIDLFEVDVVRMERRPRPRKSDESATATRIIEMFRIVMIVKTIVMIFGAHVVTRVAVLGLHLHLLYKNHRNRRPVSVPRSSVDPRWSRMLAANTNRPHTVGVYQGHPTVGPRALLQIHALVHRRPDA